MSETSKEYFKSMLNNFIHGKTEECDLDFHQAIVSLTKEKAGIGAPQEVTDDSTDVE